MEVPDKSSGLSGGDGRRVVRLLWRSRISPLDFPGWQKKESVVPEVSKKLSGISLELLYI